VPDIDANGTTVAVAWYNSGAGACYADVLTVPCGGTLEISEQEMGAAPARRKRSPAKPVRAKRTSGRTVTKKRKIASKRKTARGKTVRRAKT